MAIFWEITRLRSFLLGKKFVVFCDHKPLKFIFNSEKSSPKVLRWKMQLQEFNFRVEHCSGKSNTAADCLSRINSIDVLPGETFVSEESIMEAQKFDIETQQMIKFIEGNGQEWPEGVSQTVWKMRKSLTVADGILQSMFGKMFIPFRLRLKVLTVAHGCHSGYDTTYLNIRNRFCFPDLSNCVKHFVANCRICNMVKPKFDKPPPCPVLTKAPMEVLALDFVGPLPSSKGHQYLLVAIDIFSRYPFVFPLKDMKTGNVINKLKEIFALLGFPDSILTDQGKQFESDAFYSFFKKISIKKLRTNTYHPQGNSICERFNYTFKKLMKSYVLEKCLNFSDWIESINSSLLAVSYTHLTLPTIYSV